MSGPPTLTTITTPFNRVDALGGQAVNHGGTFIDTLATPLTWVVGRIQSLEVKKSPEFISPFQAIAKKILEFIEAFKEYHQDILHESNEWANNIGKTAQNITGAFFFPISFCRTGEALQKIISEKVVGRLAHAIALCAFQIFQTIPYLAIATAGVGVNIIYRTAPVALITFFLGSILILQVYFLFRLEREVNILIQELNISTLFKKLVWDGVDCVKGGVIGGLKASVSWIPIGSRAPDPAPHG